MDKWKCKNCGAKNPGSRYMCYKRNCKGMSEEGFQKFVAIIGIMKS